MAPAIRQGPVVNRLVSDARPQTRRRGTRAILSSRLAGAVDRHRHLRILARRSRRRVPGRLTDSAARRAIGRAARYLQDEVPAQLPQRDHVADRDATAVDDWHELSVANPTFLLVIWGR